MQTILDKKKCFLGTRKQTIICDVFYTMEYILKKKERKKVLISILYGQEECFLDF